MTLMSTKYFCQKNYFEAIFFSYKQLCEKRCGISAITESRKLKNLDFVSIFQTLSRFCYNALTNLMSQYTKIYSNMIDNKKEIHMHKHMHFWYESKYALYALKN
jgi:hypothetical protein